MSIGKIKYNYYIHLHTKIGIANKYIAFSQYNYFLNVFNAYSNNCKVGEIGDSTIQV